MKDTPAARKSEFCVPRSTVEVVYASGLEHMADVMQVAGWRRHRYIRCPDLIWAAHGMYVKHQPGLLTDTNNPNVQAVVEALKESQSIVLELPHTPQEVLSALYHINYDLRRDPGLFQREPRAFSWAFIRVVDDEMDARFWEVFWRMVGAPREDFEKFLLAHTPRENAEHIARVLNCLPVPSPTCPSFRTPEVIVLVGTERFSRSLEGTKNPASRPRALPRVLADLATLDVLPCQELRQLLGKTRLILLPGDSELIPAEPRVDEEVSRLSKMDLVVLQALGTFRWGFTQVMASLMLDVLREDEENGIAAWELRGEDLRDKLRDDFVSRQLLRYGEGLYHMSSHVREKLGAPHDSVVLARRHVAAGVALAPYVAPFPVPAMAFDLAFLPENVHEAYYHFQAAFQLSQERDQKVATKAREAMAHLLRFVELPHWHALHALNKGKMVPEDAWAFGTALLDTADAFDVPCSPVYLQEIARAGMGFLRFLRGQGQRDEADEVLQRVEDVFRQAREACDRPEWRADRMPNLLRVLSLRATFLMEEGPERASEARETNAEIWQYLNSGESGVTIWGRWFEVLGDGEEHDATAAAVYRRGAQDVPTWNQSWIKGAGAEIVGRIPDPWILTHVREMSAEDVAEVLKKAASGLWEVQKGRVKDDWVLKRWQEGFKFFEAVWGSHPDVRPYLTRYRVLFNRPSKR